MLRSYPLGACTYTALRLFSGFVIKQQNKHTKQIIRKFFCLLHIRNDKMHAICAFANFSWNYECTTIHVGVFRITLGLGIEISKDIFFFIFQMFFASVYKLYGLIIK